nr:voltage-dependent anion-selective channel isoform X2 [Bactrocera oleae]XP_036228400.1 voltage-dependent anion-selective channel isoform X2 [Bactrocera oleae]XP_036228401.1 voltage-dependent anion-selective channel isoform X2 [Bactrocera oleae]
MIIEKGKLRNENLTIYLQMAPPSYPDLGKQARDVFSKGYHFGLWKLDCKTKTPSGIEFNTAGHSNQESGKVFGSLETKYKVKDYGLSLTEKWNTDNTLFTEVSVQDKLLEGLKLAFEATFAPQSGNKTGKFKAAYGHENVKVDSDVNVDLNGPLINASAVLGYEGWLAGYQTAFDTQNNSLKTNNFALGYAAKDFVLHTAVNDGQEFTGSIFQKCTPKLDVAVQLSWTSGGNNTKFGLGGKYLIDDDISVRAKVNNASQVGLGYQQRVRDGITVSLSALIDGKNFNAGGHKIGVALELEA